MFCHKCGNQINENASFCSKCGSKVGVADTTENTTEEPAKTVSSARDNVSTLVCPKCGGTNLTSVIKPKVSGGNSASDACCGYALLGPLGLLCGLHKTNIDNQAFWLCQDCGEQIRDAKELSQQMLSYGIAFIIVGGFMLWAQIESDLWWPLWLFGIGFITCGVGLITLWQKLKK